MSNYKKLSKEEIVKQYNLLQAYYQKYLKRYGVEPVRLLDKSGKFSKNALTLIYLSLGYPQTKPISKTELTHFIKDFYPNVNDVQQARHLGAQQGWYIAAGGRDNIVVDLHRGEYQLYSLEQFYPGFRKQHRITDLSNWEDIKAKYGYRCATCGSQEGKAHFHWPATKTKLQKSHQDPNKPLIAGNIIPQCQKCNRADRNRWVYDDKGRVIKLANPKFILNSDKEILWNVYKILYKKFAGKNPYEK